MKDLLIFEVTMVFVLKKMSFWQNKSKSDNFYCTDWWMWFFSISLLSPSVTPDQYSNFLKDFLLWFKELFSKYWLRPILLSLMHIINFFYLVVKITSFLCPKFCKREHLLPYLAVPGSEWSLNFGPSPSKSMCYIHYTHNFRRKWGLILKFPTYFST